MAAAIVSVIVPNYNHARFLRQRLDTILAQTFPDFELILLDDCSSDGSQQILGEYASRPRVSHVVFNETNSGSTFKQWNKGVRLAHGEYVWIAESDDYSAPTFVGRMLAVLQSDPAITFAYCRSQYVDSGGRQTTPADSSLLYDPPWEEGFCRDGREACGRLFLPFNPVANASAVLFRKDIYERVGGADESLRLCGDWKLWAAMALEGKLAYVSEPLNYFRVHGSSVRDQVARARMDVAEFLHIAQWISTRVPLADHVFEKTCEQRAGLWVPAVMSMSVPLAMKARILRNAWAFDPHPVRSAVRPALRTVRLKIRRHWRGAS